MHDPTWFKFHAGELVGGCGILGLAALRFKNILERRKRNIVKQTAATYARFPAHLMAPRNHTVRNAVITLSCIGFSALGGLFALKNYIILTNWDEGHYRDLIGDHVGAIICYKKALRMDFGLRHTHFLIGESLVRAGRVHSAIPELELAASGDQIDPLASSSLGDAYRSVNMPYEAALAYKQATTISSLDPTYYIHIGRCMEQLHRTDIAYSAYDAAIRVDPQCESAYIQLGSLLVNTGHLDEGRANLKKAISIAPRDVLAHSTLATAYARFEMYDDAIAEFRKAIGINPKFSIAWFNLGVALEHMKQWERALEAFNNCAKLSPTGAAEKRASALASNEIRTIQARLRRE